MSTPIQLEKQPEILELEIQQGTDKETGQPCPIANMPGGKIVLFNRRDHGTVKPGQRWECEIIDEKPNLAFAKPIRKVFPASDGVVMGSYALTVTLNALNERLIHLRKRRKDIDTNLTPMTERLAVLDKERQGLVEKVKAYEAERFTMNDEIEDIVDAIDDIERAHGVVDEVSREIRKDL